MKASPAIARRLLNVRFIVITFWVVEWMYPWAFTDGQQNIERLDRLNASLVTGCLVRCSGFRLSK